MIPQTLAAGLYLVAGAVLAAVYLGGLWLSLQGLQRARGPAVVSAGSRVVRTVGTAALLVLVTRGCPGPLLLAMTGFVGCRTCVVFLIGRREGSWI